MVQVYFPILKQEDAIGRPGSKVEILDPVSTNYIDVYCYNSVNDTYTIVENPIYLDNDGRPSQTYFVKQFAYLRLYDYLGDFTDPRTDDDSNNWSFVRDWYNSIDLDTGTGENLDVYGLYGLMDADVSLGSVDVVGYWTNDDCEKRTYVWDSQCVAEADAGYVVASNSTEVGRWILKFDGEYLPSTYYGVYPGHEENINALLVYPNVVGTNELQTAPGVWFEPGSYTEREAALSTEKKLLLDANTHFICDIYCNSVDVVGSVTAPIANIIVSDTNQVIHSSWYRDAYRFFQSGGGTLVFDKDNYFYNRTIPYNITVQNKIIEGASTLGTLNYTNNCRITFSQCDIKGVKLWDRNSRVGFLYTTFCDKWFNITGNSDWDFVDKISCRSRPGLNRIELHNFDNPYAFILAKRANGETTISLEGRVMNNVDLSGFTNISNVNCSSLSISAGIQNVSLLNVRASSLSVACNQLTVYDSEVTFPNEPNISAAWFNDSRIWGGYIFSSTGKQYIFNNCFVGISFKRVSDNTIRDAWLEFNNCDFQENCIIESKTLTMTNCTTHNNTIRVYPYKTDDKYYMWVKLLKNSFDNTTPIEFTKVDTINGSYQDDVYEIIVNWNICDNLFIGNNEGLRCRYWQHRTGSNYGKTFIAGTGNSIIYTGNTGNCPKDTARNMMITSNKTYTTYQFGDYTLYKYSQSNTRIMPGNQVSTAWPAGYFFTPINETGTLMKYYSWVNSPYNSLTYDMFIQTTWYLYHTSIDDQVNNGDFFAMSIMLFNDYLRIVQRGDGDRNDGIIGKVL